MLNSQKWQLPPPRPCGDSRRSGRGAGSCCQCALLGDASRAENRLAGDSCDRNSPDRERPAPTMRCSIGPDGASARGRRAPSPPRAERARTTAAHVEPRCCRPIDMPALRGPNAATPSRRTRVANPARARRPLTGCNCRPAACDRVIATATCEAAACPRGDRTLLSAVGLPLLPRGPPPVASIPARPRAGWSRVQDRRPRQCPRPPRCRARWARSGSPDRHLPACSGR